MYILFGVRNRIISSSSIVRLAEQKGIRRRILVLKEDKETDRKNEGTDNHVGKGVKVEEVRLGTKDLWHGCGLPEYLFPSSTGLPNRREIP